MHRLSTVWVLVSALLLFGCGSGIDTDFDTVPSDSTGATTGRGFLANFDLTAGKIPTATDLLLSGTTDLTLNIPVEDPDDISNPRVAINALDGFSTVAPITTTFAAAIDAASLTPATVRVFQVALDTLGGTKPVGGPVRSVTRELTFGVEFVATLSSVDATGSTLVVLPLVPLLPRTSYLVALTHGIKSVDGRSAMASDHYLTAKTTPNSLTGSPAAALEPVRQLVQAQEAALAAFGVDPDPIVLSWVFTTQSAGVVLGTVRSLVQGADPAPSTLVDTTADSPLGVADIYAGTLEIPYYLSAATLPSDGSPSHDPTPLGTWWQAANELGGETNLTFANSLPAVTSTETIPLLASIPKGEKPEGGWPVVIYQHGITSNRATLLAIADALAGAGFAAVAIDLPLHGLTGNETDGTAAFRMAGLERTFDLDLVDNATGAPGPDGIIDASGTHMINLASLLTTRDNGRQAVADLFVLTKALDEMDYDGGGADFDIDRISFVGHSLGGIVGGTFLALEPDVNSGILGMPGGAIAKLLDGSATFGPRIAAGLAGKGVIKGTADYESFMGAFQTVIDATDPINYTSLTGLGRGILLFEVVGDGGTVNKPDQVVPNNVFADAPSNTVRSPTASTDPLAMYMGLSQISATTTGTDLQAWVRFTAGDHSSLLSPATSLEATTEMQKQMATFLATDGGTVLVSDTSVVEQP